jgi:hypothetical protein
MAMCGGGVCAGDGDWRCSGGVWWSCCGSGVMR